nr:mitochondrial import inner membrane translocase subunit TIM50 [Ciona intestinalis]|eukprot:XP_009857806.2 mitochondrial import inner membrane translocase subunit TIM50 [Ciona intestinalis]
MSCRIWVKCKRWNCNNFLKVTQSFNTGTCNNLLEPAENLDSCFISYSSYLNNPHHLHLRKYKQMAQRSVRPFNLSFSTGTSLGKADTPQDLAATKIIPSVYNNDLKTNKYPPEHLNDKNNNSHESKESPFMRSQRFAKWILLGSFAICTPLFILTNGRPKVDQDGNKIIDEFTENPVPIAYLKRAWGEINLVKKDIVEPSSKKLLPDPLEEPYYQPPFTLVIELMDVFLRPVYDSVTGWRFKKRPGIDYFLSQVGPPLYEVVIFTRETGMTAFPLIDSMDSKGYIMYRLFRDSARYQSGFTLGSITKGKLPKLDPYYQKDLKYLNRDLSRVIMVDCDQRACEKQPENGLCLSKWDGDSNDTTLFDLAALLRTIATSNVDDVRPILKHYGKYSDPIHAFKLAQVRMQQETTQPKETSQAKSEIFSRTGSALSSFFKIR